MPGGHPPPGIWDEPHFDVHFYYLSQDAVEQINPENSDFATKGMLLPDAKYIPQDFAAVLDTPVEEAVIPGMGQHLVDSSVALAPGEFTEVLINGTWDGTFAFVEPMVTPEFLLIKPNVTKDLKLSEAYQKTG